MTCLKKLTVNNRRKVFWFIFGVWERHGPEHTRRAWSSISTGIGYRINFMTEFTPIFSVNRIYKTDQFFQNIFYFKVLLLKIIHLI